MIYNFSVDIDADSKEEAERVMHERLMHDEDYGFRYQIVSFYGRERVFQVDELLNKVNRPGWEEV